MSWTQVNNNRWVRSDGAVVMWDQRSPWPNPVKESARMWTAWEPEPSQRYIEIRRGRYRKNMDGDFSKPSFPRRWKTPKSAMKKVDELYPVEVKMIGSDFVTQVCKARFRCGECPHIVLPGDTYLASIKDGKMRKRVCSENCRLEFDARVWEQIAQKNIVRRRNAKLKKESHA